MGFYVEETSGKDLNMQIGNFVDTKVKFETLGLGYLHEIDICDMNKVTKHKRKSLSEQKRKSAKSKIFKP